jgi:predicted nucleic acid-binding protein
LTPTYGWLKEYVTQALRDSLYRHQPLAEVRLAEHCRLGAESRKLWTDAYLAAFARAGGIGLATFDRGFRRHDGLDLILLG